MWAISESFKKVKSPIIMLFLKASIVSQHLTVRCQYMVNSGLQVLVMDGKVFAQRFTCVSGYLVHMHVEQSLTRTNKSPCSHALKGPLRSNSMVGGWTYSSHAFLSGILLMCCRPQWTRLPVGPAGRTTQGPRTVSTSSDRPVLTVMLMSHGFNYYSRCDNRKVVFYFLLCPF